MFYVLFTYSKGQRERDFRAFRIDDDVIKFIHENYEKIDIVQIIAAEKSFRLGLIETEELAKSTLISQDIETDLPNPGEEKTEETEEEKILKKNKAALKRGDEAMDAARKDLEKTKGFIPRPVVESIKRGYKRKKDERTDDEKTKDALHLKAAGKKAMEEEKKGWATCPECNKNKIAPWNESGRCSECQQRKKKPKKKSRERPF